MTISSNKMIQCLFAVVFITCFTQNALARDYTGFDLVWSEEFDGDKLDEDVWMFDAGTGVWNTEANAELQHYTDRIENVFVENGVLHIRAIRENYFGTREFTSGRIKTQGRVNYMYGWVEIRTKLPDTRGGLWPAFWMMGDEALGWPYWGEIDIIEGGKKIYSDAEVGYKVPSALHFWNEDTDAWEFIFYEQGDAGLTTTLWDDYHLFQMYWDATKIQFYIDDQPTPYYEVLFADYPNLTDEFQNTGFYFLANLAVGGDFTGNYTPDSVTATLPADLLIDYIRVYQQPGQHNVTQAADREKSGTFGVFTENTPTTDAIDFNVDGNDILNWEGNFNLGIQSPAEGSESLAYVAKPGIWGGVGIHTNGLLNMERYKNGHLHFKFKTNSPDDISIGIESTGADKTIYEEPNMVVLFKNGVANPYGLERDGNWHDVTIPLDVFNNIDFKTIKIPFRFSTSTATGAWQYEVDDIYWTESVAVPTPSNGDYGVYAETGTFVDTLDNNGGDIFIWGDSLNEITGTTPSEGTESLAYVGTMEWFGMAITPKQRHNLSAFLASGSLKFDMKVPASNTSEFKIGLKTGTVDDAGDRFVIFTNSNNPYGFVRNNTWQTVIVPLADLDLEIRDLEQVSHLFVLFGAKGSIGQIEFDNISYIGGGPPVSDCKMSIGSSENGDVEYSATGCATGQTAILNVLVNGAPLLTNVAVAEGNAGEYRYVDAASNYSTGDGIEAQFSIGSDTVSGSIVYEGPNIDMVVNVEPLTNGNMLYSLTVNQALIRADLYVKSNGGLILNPVDIGVIDNGDGTFTYSVEHAASNYEIGDSIEARFEVLHTSGTLYAPGPSAADWTSPYTYVGVSELWTMLVEELANGDMKYSVSTDIELFHALLFVKKNGIHVLASIEPSMTNDGSGTFTYSYTHPAVHYSAGDSIEGRYYLYHPSIGQIFVPGPTDATWTDPHIYGADPGTTSSSISQGLNEIASSSD